MQLARSHEMTDASFQEACRSALSKVLHASQIGFEF